MAGAVAVVIVNTDKNLVRLPAPPEYDTKGIRIPTFIVAPALMDIMPEYMHDFTPVARVLLFDP